MTGTAPLADESIPEFVARSRREQNKPAKVTDQRVAATFARSCVRPST